MAQRIDLTQQVQGILPEANGGAGPHAGERFADTETPSGSVNGSNVVFKLQNIPSPVQSMQLFQNKVLQIQGVDYTVSSNVITFASAPTTGTVLAWYRYRQQSFSLNLIDQFSPWQDTILPLTYAATYPLSIEESLTMGDSFLFSLLPMTMGMGDTLPLQLDSIKLFLSAISCSDQMATMSDAISLAFPANNQSFLEQMSLSDAVSVSLH